MSSDIPHLGDKGYVNSELSPSDILSLEFAHVFESDYSQSTLWLGKVTSVQWLIKEYGNEPQEMAIQLKKALDNLYGRHFKSTEINVTVSSENLAKVGYGLDINCIVFTEDTAPHTLYRSLFINPDEQTANVIKAINN